MSIRIVLADDHRLVRAGLAKLVTNLPNTEVVGEANNGEEALQLITKLKPDIVLMDIHMPRLNGLESIARLSKEQGATRSIVLSMYANEEYILRALRAGASGYLLKDSGPEELELAIITVMRGESYLDSRVSALVSAYVRQVEDVTDPLDKLTTRQREVLQLIAQGASSKDIAKTLDISLKTVEAHRGQLMKTLNINDIAGLVRFAIRTGLITAED